MGGDWGCFGTIHVIPLDDLEVHDESLDCACSVKSVEQYPGGTVVTHTSYDGREAVEWAEEILERLEETGQ